MSRLARRVRRPAHNTDAPSATRPVSAKPSAAAHLQRTLGNRATTQLLSRTLRIQAQLRAGGSRDATEREAETQAARTVARLELTQTSAIAGNERVSSMSEGDRTPSPGGVSGIALPAAVEPMVMGAAKGG